jgi:hypothetical protein
VDADTQAKRVREIALIVDPKAFSKHASCFEHYAAGSGFLAPKPEAEARAIADTAWGGAIKEALAKAELILALADAWRDQLDAEQSQ